MDWCGSESIGKPPDKFFLLYTCNINLARIYHSTHIVTIYFIGNRGYNIENKGKHIC